MTREVTFGPEAVAYIRSCLEQGHTLSTFLRELPLERGRVVTCLPGSASADASRHFMVGGITTRRLSEEFAAATILTYFKGSGRGCAMFEDALAQPGDAFLRSARVPVITHDREVYYVLGSAVDDPALVVAALRRATSHLFIGVLAELPSESAALANGNVTAQALRRVASSAAHILVGAYDGEGVLLWSRPANGP